MFTGIVEKTGKVVDIIRENTNVHFVIEVDFAHELKIDQSMSHDGCCLTIVKIDKEKNQYVVTAMQETLIKTNLGTWNIGYEVNLERSMKMDGRFDGHIVQGHVDQTARCIKVVDENGSWRYYFEYDPQENNITVPKGSISVNGVSLTVVDSEKGMFSVAIIPYTYEVTNFRNFKVGTIVNIEFDVFGKYVARLLEQYFENEKK
ncbi:MAG TPA: riboflavin synthase [Bacteroidales bacterium]|jgi:riboflavin synthase|nr:riboflavin synthase [Bacteroidales bacterium]HOF16259.1 riboflavin synthase [Bacteroidales bacterium]HON20971.1 riboflavin synthase [Bacteroidales bacterium]HOR82256.1 riboflavin synthase [Bacteroidales bacterium]HPJ91531.1 riboflavin synthase [Bacteroidales bacterium]